jgi:exopolyphosphatase/guanosine-5'-triphosphate,3'-diphosphate pyrophosphatase
MVTEEEKKYMNEWLSEIKDKYDDVKAIGSGGNINKIYKFSENKEGKGLFYHELKQIYKEIKDYSYEDRLKILGFNPDRADVIIPAAEIFLNVMKQADIGKIHVPKIGLADGIIQLEYRKFKEEVNQDSH